MPLRFVVLVYELGPCHFLTTEMNLQNNYGLTFSRTKIVFFILYLLLLSRNHPLFHMFLEAFCLQVSIIEWDYADPFSYMQA